MSRIATRPLAPQRRRSLLDRPSLRSGPSSSARGDVNADGVVNSIDLGMVIGSWGVCPE
jgi:hypothetical protein